MHVVQTNVFKKALKNLHHNQKVDLDEAVRALMQAPKLGAIKTGDLNGVRVYKFKMQKQHCLLAYSFQEDNLTLTLLALGAHENFYRDLKKSQL